MKAKLLANIGARSEPANAKVLFVPIDPAQRQGLFHRGNSILFFRKDPSLGIVFAFEEVVLTKVSRRGSFWQEHDHAIAEDLRRTLAAELRQANA